MAAKAKSTKSNKTVSVQEIKYWLSGIIEFQDKGWIPNKEQWENIKDKIMSLDETIREVQVPVNVPVRVANGVQPPTAAQPVLPSRRMTIDPNKPLEQQIDGFVGGEPTDNGNGFLGPLVRASDAPIPTEEKIEEPYRGGSQFV